MADFDDFDDEIDDDIDEIDEEIDILEEDISEESEEDDESEEEETEVEEEEIAKGLLNTIDYYHPKLTKFELAKLIGFRATQISENSPVYLPTKEIEGIVDPIQLAINEYNADKGILSITRSFPYHKKILKQSTFNLSDLITFPIIE